MLALKSLVLLQRVWGGGGGGGNYVSAGSHFGIKESREDEVGSDCSVLCQELFSRCITNIVLLDLV